VKSLFGWEPPSNTLVEVLVIIAIVGTLGALLVPAAARARRAADLANTPQQQPAEPEAASWYLRTRQHDGHWWVMAIVGESHTPVHHPDCPCRQRSPEAPE
jgi:hypothetical protein